jgi:tRNA dimethylallyltransferase
MGPTASGKTALSIKLGQHFPIEIINVDSTLIYRGMDIGSGKPTLAERNGIQHHLIDIRDPHEIYSAAQFRTDALALIPEILARGNLPVLVGGTMLYFKTLQEGISEIPAIKPGIRQFIEARAKDEGWSALYSELKTIDPIVANRISASDQQRIQRALEVYVSTGKPLSEYWGQSQESSPYDFLSVALVPKSNCRVYLHNNIEARFKLMLKAGFIEEVTKLKSDRRLNLELPALRSVGYRQIWQYLDQEISFDALEIQAVAATRQLAKRQLTWLRQWNNLHTLDFLDKNSLSRVCQLILSFPLRAKSNSMYF